MMMFSHTVARSVALSVLIAAGSQATASEINVTMRKSTAMARAGIPVVVELVIANRTPDPQEVYALVDPYLILTNWEWLSDGKEHVVRPLDLHFSVLPRPSPPRRLSIPASATMSWYFTIPTPEEFGDGAKWTLRSTIRAAFSPNGRNIAQEATFVGNDLDPRLVAERIGSTFAQAGLLEWPRQDVFVQLNRKGLIPEVERCFAEGDRQAEMMLFSHSLITGKGVLKFWQGLDNAPDEMLCLRNYLLLVALRDTRRHLRVNKIVLLSPNEEATLRKTLKPESYFAKELDEALQQARANAARFAR